MPPPPPPPMQKVTSDRENQEKVNWGKIEKKHSD